MTDVVCTGGFQLKYTLPCTPLTALCVKSSGALCGGTERRKPHLLRGKIISQFFYLLLDDVVTTLMSVATDLCVLFDTTR